MATTFKKGDMVKLKAVTPEGPVQSIAMDDEGNVSYLVSWTNEDGVEHQRWFPEASLVSA
jgi:uncharacterized protein YodC (DUF2158 family)